jgi:RNA polymerase sigma-70 factor (ECF subfamily)
LTLVPGAADADDIMQETSLALWQKFQEFDPQRDFFRWACGVAYVAVLRFRRSHSKDKLWFNEELLELISNDLLDRKDTRELRRQALSECMKKLEPGERRFIDARYSAGSSVGEHILDNLPPLVHWPPRCPNPPAPLLFYSL